MIDVVKNTAIMSIVFLGVWFIVALVYIALTFGFVYFGMGEEGAKLVATIALLVIILFIINLVEAN